MGVVERSTEMDRTYLSNVSMVKEEEEEEERRKEKKRKEEVRLKTDATRDLYLLTKASKFLFWECRQQHSTKCKVQLSRARRTSIRTNTDHRTSQLNRRPSGHAADPLASAESEALD